MKLFVALLTGLWLVSCQPMDEPKAIQPLIATWRVKQIDSPTVTQGVFYQQNAADSTQQPDLVLFALTFTANHTVNLHTGSGTMTGTWEYDAVRQIYHIRMGEGVYTLANVTIRQGVLSFESIDLSSFLGKATYWLESVSQ